MDKLQLIPYPNEVRILPGSIPLSKIGRRSFFSTIDRNTGNPESYYLSISENGVKIVAGGEAGRYYAAQTLKQISEAYPDRLPFLEIRDKPAFPYRGFMLDSVRHMTPIEDIKKLIDAAALLKLNKFHWHLTDDQGWRIEIDSYPLLNEVASYRNGSHFGKVHDDRIYGGYYTKREMREIADYCADRHIDVIPEIDMPGHMVAAIAAYPEISCRGEEIPVEIRQGIFPDILCAGNPKTLQMIFDILDEVIRIFPCKYIHIGGDEAPKKRWKECRHCQELIRELGLETEEELQGWFMNRVAEFLQSRGRKAITWNESLNSGLLNKDIIVQMWMDRKKLSVDFANSGGNIIVSPFYHYYLDYPYGMTPLNKTYKFDPILKGLDNQGAGNVAGVETPVWTEHIRDFNQLCFMAFPRAAAVAEAGWTFEENRDVDDFNVRLQALTPRLRSLGIKPAPEKDWNPNPFRRLIQTIRFFLSITTKEMIKGYD